MSGELRIREKIGNEKSLSLFDEVDSHGPVRFAAWVNYNAGAREIFAQDRYTGELKMFTGVQGKKVLRLFDLPVDDLAWSRYQSWPDYVLDRYWTYTFDSATSELTSDSHFSFKTPYVFPASRKYVPPSGRRYDGHLIREIGGGGVITLCHRLLYQRSPRGQGYRRERESYAFLKFHSMPDFLTFPAGFMR